MVKPLVILVLILKTCSSVDVGELPPVHHSDIDNFDNTYYFNETQDIQKQTIGDSIVKKFGLSNYGNDPIIDASFPLEVATFFYKNGNLVLLDNQLNIVLTRNVYETNPMSVSHFGRSIEGFFWVFNQNTKTLQKISHEGKLITQSNIISNIENNGIQRIHDMGTEVYIQNGNDLVKFSPNLKYIETEKNTYLIRSYKFPAKIIKNKLKFTMGKKNFERQVGQDSIPIGLSKNKYVLHSKNGLILQSIE